MDAERQKRVNEIAAVAVKVERESQVPAESTVAQWAVESKWGAAPCGHANYFGIKRSDRHAKFCIETTHEWYTDAQIAAWNNRHSSHPARKTGRVNGVKLEVELDDEFADYDSLGDSVRDYAWLVSHGERYAEAWKRFLADRKIPEFVAGIAKAYSTSSAYTALVTGIAGQGNVVGPIKQARAALAAAA